MGAWLFLALLAVEQPSTSHVRTTEARILALIDEGRSRSATFRQLVETLDESDVIVYIEPKRNREALGGFLLNDVAGRGGWRYVRVAVEVQGANRRVIALLAHELQHAVEVARAPQVHDAASLREAFSRQAVKFGCGGECYETQAAKDVEWTVNKELGATPIARSK
jgi:hypothetical protein